MGSLVANQHIGQVRADRFEEVFFQHRCRGGCFPTAASSSGCRVRACVCTFAAKRCGSPAKVDHVVIQPAELALSPLGPAPRHRSGVQRRRLLLLPQLANVGREEASGASPAGGW